MQYGEYKFAIQRGSLGYFAKVSLEVALEGANQGLTVDFAFGDTGLQRWQSAIQFGVAYVWDKLPNKFGRSMHVVVREIDYNPVDTSQMAMAFATIHALFNALDWLPGDAPTFDPESGLFIFPTRAT